MSRRTLFIVMGIAIIAVIAVLYACVDPLEAKWMPKCAVYTLTGIKCPGCGTQRALHALFTGHFREMIAANPLLLLALPVIALYFYAEINRCRRPRLFLILNSGGAVGCILAVTLAWTILRNLFGW